MAEADGRMQRASESGGMPASMAALMGLAAALFILATWNEYGYAIDEATYLWVAREARTWFAESAHRPLSESFSAEAIAARFHFLESPFDRPMDRHSNFNLPASIHVMNVGWLVGHRILDELRSLRLGSAMLFGVTVFAAVRVTARAGGSLCGVACGMFLTLMPRLFGHAHLAATETALVCFWLLACLALIDAVDGSTVSWRSAGQFGVALGLLFATKATGWSIAAPIFVWLLWARPKGGTRLAVAGVVGVIGITYVLTPPLYRDPVAGVSRLIQLSINNPWRIPSVYFGDAYGADMPWHAGLVVFGITAPMATLALGLLGAAMWRKNSAALLLGLNAAALLAMRTFKLMPTHDVDRQFAPLYGIWALLAGFGVGAAGRWMAATLGVAGRQRTVVQWATAAIFLVEPACDTWAYRGNGLMYYNRAVGGLTGADRLGMEVSYWFEGMRDSDWKAMAAKLPVGARVFLRPDHPGLDYLKETGLWRPDLQSVGPEEADFFLLYARKAAYAVEDPATGEFVLTDLLALQRTGPAVWHRDWDAVRLASLVSRR